MKRVFFGVAFALVFGAALYAEEGVLIDFSLLTADLRSGDKARGNPETFTARTRNDDGSWNDGTEGLPGLNKQTVVDFRNRPGITGFTPEQKNAMRTSLAIENWLVDISSSSQTPTNMSASYTKEINSALYTKVLGVRVHLPLGAYNGWSLIRPPFDIPAYDRADPPESVDAPVSDNPDKDYDAPTRFENGYGVIKNVGTVKQIAVNVYGLNYPYSLNLLYEDGNNITHEVSLGSLNFDGWATLTWENPDYLTDVRQRTLRIYPIYPTYAPYIKFVGFRIKRDAMQDGGDFIAYFKDVKVIYDRAQLTAEADNIPARDINDEKEWGIIQNREDNKRQLEQQNFGLDQLYRYQESRKQARDDPFDKRPEATAPQGGAAQE